MRSASLGFLLSLALLGAGCGGDDKGPAAPAATTAATPPAASETAEPTSDGGMGSSDFSAMVLRTTTIAEVRKRFGPPVKTSKPESGTTCLDYAAYDDDTGEWIEGQGFRLCFDKDGLLIVRTTTVEG